MQQHKVMLVDAQMEGVGAIQEQEVEVQDCRGSTHCETTQTPIKLVVMDSIPLSQVHLFGEEEEVEVFVILPVIMLVVEVEVVMAQYYMMMLLVPIWMEMINLVVEVQEPLVIKTEVTEEMGL